MKKEEIIYKANYAPEDYTFAIIKEWHMKPNAERFITNPDNDPLIDKEFDYKVVLIEFEKHFYLNTLDNIDEVIHARISNELDAIKQKNPKKIPIPQRLSSQYTGKLSLRISPALHKKLHIESLITDTSVNKLIEKKLNTES